MRQEKPVIIDVILSLHPLKGKWGNVLWQMKQTVPTFTKAQRAKLCQFDTKNDIVAALLERRLNGTWKEGATKAGEHLE